MKPLRLAFAFLKMPRLAIRLVLVPILVAGAALLAQLFLLSLAPRSPTPVNTSILGVNLAREIAFRSSEPRPEIVICNWISKGESIEFPPGKACLVGPRDVAILDAKNANKEVEGLIGRLNGNFEKIHLCTSACATGAGVKFSSARPNAEISIVGFSNLMLLNDAIAVKTNTTREAFTLPGKKSLILAGLDAPIILSGLERQIAHLLSVIMLIVCCVWLCLRAHRRVLEYFASSGSLLPIAASSGPKNLYLALWIISIIRLCAFLVLATPMLIVFIVIGSSSSANALNQLSAPSANTTLLWFIAVTASLVLTTLCASVADLKRRLIASFLWRILPLFLVGIGFVWWVFSLIEATPTTILLRHILMSIPLLGLAPLVASSIIQPPAILLVIHALIAAFLAVILARHNAKWFATHLEDA